MQWDTLSSISMTLEHGAVRERAWAPGRQAEPSRQGPAGRQTAHLRVEVAVLSLQTAQGRHLRLSLCQLGAQCLHLRQGAFWAGGVSRGQARRLQPAGCCSGCALHVPVAPSPPHLSLQRGPLA